jgi:hypothetical protein
MRVPRAPNVILNIINGTTDNNQFLLLILNGIYVTQKRSKASKIINLKVDPK